MQFIDNVETEAAEEFRRFLKSEDPAANFPDVFFNFRGTAMLQLLDHKLQLKKLMNVSDYASLCWRVAEPCSVHSRCAPLSEHTASGATVTPPQQLQLGWHLSILRPNFEAQGGRTIIFKSRQYRQYMVKAELCHG